MSDGFEDLVKLLGKKLEEKPSGSGKKSATSHMDTESLDNLLKKLLGEKIASKTSPAALSKIEQAALLEDLANTPNDLKVGDFVRRNKHGKARYRFPAKGYIGRVEAVFPYELHSDGDWINGIVHCAREDGKITCYGVDLRFYQKVEIVKPVVNGDDDEKENT